MSSLAVLAEPSLTIIIATSPLGLGHLRVTDALYHGLPKTASPILFGAKSPSASAMYRFVSIHPLTRKIMELFQTPPLDKHTALIGRTLLPLQNQALYEQVKTILNERFIVPKTVVIVAAHPVHGYQLGAIKQKLEKELAIRIILVIQVTDDSPQAIWYVPHADLIFVPSDYTKAHLLSYAKKAQLPPVPIDVTAYPVSPLLTEALSEHAFTKRVEQVHPQSTDSLHVSIPVPGAAVGTSFMSEYIKTLYHFAPRTLFHVVSREAPFTQSFIQEMGTYTFVKLYTSTHDRMTVDNYERVFKETTISLEITKPSEQAFKALTTPKQRGGALLLFSKPVGGQEYDNLHFLRTHGLMPTKEENHLLWKKAAHKESIKENELLSEAHHWRAVLLPDDPTSACEFTLWCLQEGLFTRMMHYTRKNQSVELQSNGVEQFWNAVTKLIEKV